MREAYGGHLHGRELDYEPQFGRLVVAVPPTLSTYAREEPSAFIETQTQTYYLRRLPDGREVWVEQVLDTALARCDEQARHFMGRARTFDSAGLTNLAYDFWHIATGWQNQWHRKFVSGDPHA